MGARVTIWVTPGVTCGRSSQPDRTASDDPKAMLAAPAVARLNRDLEEEWRAKARGEKPRARRRYDDAVLDARGLGFAYVAHGGADAAPIDELLKRFEKLIERRSLDVPEEVTAVSGEVTSSRIPRLRSEIVSAGVMPDGTISSAASLTRRTDAKLKGASGVVCSCTAVRRHL